MTVTITYARTARLAPEFLDLLRRILAALRKAGKWFFDNLEEAEKYAPYWYFIEPYR